jgi:hypothetical protein
MRAANLTNVQARVFGVELTLGDGCELPGLGSPSATRTSPATVVRIDPDAVVSRWDGAGGVRTRDLRHGAGSLTVDYAPASGYLLNAPGTGAALISPDGLEVVCAPDPASPDWEALLGGQVLPLVATVRGREVFHAAGVVCGDRAMMLCGPQRVGKTSLAAHLALSGAELLSDDVVALDERLCAHSGVAVLHIRDAELKARAGSPIPGYDELGITRRRMRLAARRSVDACPLGAVYLLERAPSGEPIEPILAPDPVSLLGATFNLSVQTGPRLVRQLDICARIATEVPIFRVRIVPGVGAAELARALFDRLCDGTGARL